MLDGRDARPLVIAGGDGTLHRAVAALYRRGELADAELGLIPVGTGNDFARGANVPLDPKQAAEVVLTGTVQPVDLVVDDAGDIAVNNVHLGVGSEASRRGAVLKERLGRVGYALGMLRASVSPAFRLQVEIDGERVAMPNRPVLEVSIGNGATVGGGLPLNPGAEPVDGNSTHGVVRDRAVAPDQLRPGLAARGIPTQRRPAALLRHRDSSRRAVLHQRRRRDLRPGAASNVDGGTRRPADDAAQATRRDVRLSEDLVGRGSYPIRCWTDGVTLAVGGLFEDGRADPASSDRNVTLLTVNHRGGAAYLPLPG